MKELQSGDLIKIKKPGHLINGQECKIESINPDCSRPVKVNVSIDWFLTLDEVEPIGEKRQSLNAMEYNEGMYETPIKMPLEAKKRGRKPKEKTEAIKEKRHYKKK